MAIKSNQSPRSSHRSGPAAAPCVRRSSADVELDASQIEAVRKGTLAAYGELYQRHVAAAYHLARQLTRVAAEQDELVAEAFARVLETLRAGGGPDSAFRAYLLAALRHVAYDKTRRERKIELTDDINMTTPMSPRFAATSPRSAGWTGPRRWTT